jgi:hypothetical protein
MSPRLRLNHAFKARHKTHEAALMILSKIINKPFTNDLLLSSSLWLLTLTLSYGLEDEVLTPLRVLGSARRYAKCKPRLAFHSSRELLPYALLQSFFPTNLSTTAAANGMDNFGSDEFGSDNDLDDLPETVFSALEQDAVQATQQRSAVYQQSQKENTQFHHPPLPTLPSTFIKQSHNSNATFRTPLRPDIGPLAPLGQKKRESAYGPDDSYANDDLWDAAAPTAVIQDAQYTLGRKLAGEIGERSGQWQQNRAHTENFKVHGRPRAYVPPHREYATDPAGHVGIGRDHVGEDHDGEAQLQEAAMDNIELGPLDAVPEPPNEIISALQKQLQDVSIHMSCLS